MSHKYEVMNSKLLQDAPIYVYSYEVVKISDPIVIIYEEGVFDNPMSKFAKIRVYQQIFYDVELDNGEVVRMKQKFGEALKIGDEVHYNITVDDYTKFTILEDHPGRLNLVA